MKKLTLLLLVSSCIHVFAQETSAGPIIDEFGEVFKVANPDFEVDTDMEYKVVFDIDASPEALDQLNTSINTPARFLNMHAQSGVSAKNLKIALVVHGEAFKDILTDTAYKNRFGTVNPNRELVQALLSSGAQIILCGQTASYQKISSEDMLPEVQMALSAMTALVQLQRKEYQLIKF